MNLQLLFDEPILSIQQPAGIHSDAAPSLWVITTTRQIAVVRCGRPLGIFESPFWFACRRLFALDPTNVVMLAALNHSLSRLTHAPIPQVRRSIALGGCHLLVVDHLQGCAIPSFTGRPTLLLGALGRAIAEIHSRAFYYYGDALGRRRFALPTFHNRLMKTIEALISRFYAHDQELINRVPQMQRIAHQLPDPESASYAMVDIGPTQFLADGSRLTGIHDTEAYVLAPRAFELIAIESHLDLIGATAFAAGYESVLPLPPLRDVRPLYRCFLHLARAHPHPTYELLAQHPPLFDT
jgi:hypothetical protein